MSEKETEGGRKDGEGRGTKKALCNAMHACMLSPFLARACHIPLKCRSQNRLRSHGLQSLPLDAQEIRGSGSQQVLIALPPASLSLLSALSSPLQEGKTGACAGHPDITRRCLLAAHYEKRGSQSVCLPPCLSVSLPVCPPLPPYHHQTINH